jgi:hypothetical protein
VLALEKSMKAENEGSLPRVKRRSVKFEKNCTKEISQPPRQPHFNLYRIAIGRELLVVIRSCRFNEFLNNKFVSPGAARGTPSDAMMNSTASSQSGNRSSLASHFRLSFIGFGPSSMPKSLRMRGNAKLAEERQSDATLQFAFITTSLHSHVS